MFFNRRNILFVKSCLAANRDGEETDRNVGQALFLGRDNAQGLIDMSRLQYL